MLYSYTITNICNLYRQVNSLSLCSFQYFVKYNEAEDNFSNRVLISKMINLISENITFHDYFVPQFMLFGISEADIES